MVKENIIKQVLTALFLFFSVRQYLQFKDIYCAIFLLLIFIALITTKAKD